MGSGNSQYQDGPYGSYQQPYGSYRQERDNGVCSGGDDGPYGPYQTQVPYGSHGYRQERDHGVCGGGDDGPQGPYQTRVPYGSHGYRQDRDEGVCSGGDDRYRTVPPWTVPPGTLPPGTLPPGTITGVPPPMWSSGDLYAGGPGSSLQTGSYYAGERRHQPPMGNPFIRDIESEERKRNGYNDHYLRSQDAGCCATDTYRDRHPESRAEMSRGSAGCCDTEGEPMRPPHMRRPPVEEKGISDLSYLEERFELAQREAVRRVTTETPREHKLLIYGYYKQAKEGDASKFPRPGWFSSQSTDMYDEWARHHGMPREEAMDRYIKAIELLN